jgi:hypothetical protein
MGNWKNWKNSVNVLVESFEKLSWSMLCNGFGLSIASGAGEVIFV